MAPARSRSWATTTCSTRSTWASGRRSRSSSSSAWRSSPSRSSGASAPRPPVPAPEGGDGVMAVITTPRQKVGWGTANFVVIALALIPVLWMVSLSFKTPTAVLDPSFIPHAWTWGNYTQILKTTQFIRPLINSIGIGLIATFIVVVLASMAAYAIARLRVPGKSVLIGMSLLIAMFPLIALVTPLFTIERALGLFNTWPGLIIPYVAFGLPLGIYTLSAFFREIPWELEKAAKMDGASPFQ